ncbi:probable phospholipid-transporting ATPase IA isoform X1 [Clytia hemisphaerica]|uniref:Phospholipid-transporting ATPase n=1 Tax=Clytia hemisphaerica TaxID=252671 RepID=A0A7M5XKB7_9CNID
MDCLKKLFSKDKNRPERSLYSLVENYGSVPGSDEGNDMVDKGGGNKNERQISIHNRIIPHKRFCSNKISTAKYNLATFFPKFLLEQFTRYANLFFLLIALLQQIPNVSPTGRYTTAIPLLIVLSCSAIKEIIEDFNRHRQDDQINNRLVEVVRNDEFVKIRWTKVMVGDLVKIGNGEFFPADLILIASSEPMGMCYIETANLDGETNLKIRQALPLTAGITSKQLAVQLRGQIVCEGPNNRLYDFVGNIRANDQEGVPLSSDQVLLRGAQLRNTQWIYGVVVYTGHESKLLQNATAAPIKRSNVDHTTNLQILFLFGLLITLAFFSAIGSIVWTSDHEKDWYFGFQETSAQNFGFTFLTFFILYNNLIPISLPVTLEVVKFIQAQFINWDMKMYYEPSDTPAMARTSNLNEELGQVKYIFSDKTGTLTRNIMELKKLSIAGKVYSLFEKGKEGEELSSQLSLAMRTEEQKENIQDFVSLLSVCHTVVPERDREDSTHIIYQGASPDEEALVKGSVQMGCRFTTRTPTAVIIDVERNGERVDRIYEILNVLEFNSTRKRMSVIVKTPEGQIKVMTKGADNVIFERLAEHQNEMVEQTLQHLRDFANEGLRTLCIAYTDLDPQEYEEWNMLFHKASLEIDNRDTKVAEVAELIEKNLTLMGATAIEDKLQDEVPESIAKLSQANIKIWVLTGDKQETAINIGFSCKLLTRHLELLICEEGSTREQVKQWINSKIDQYHIERFQPDEQSIWPKFLQRLPCFRPKKPKREASVIKDLALIMTGSNIHHALSEEVKEDFLDLALVCRAVVACRVSPLQKSLLVQLVKENVQGAITLAVGDGANDVSMIQSAHVGVGISGQEGLQAAGASDYAIAQFKYLNRLLLVHGAFSYQRLAKLILYSFYKNICLYVIELWFATVNGFSGQILFDKWCIGLYNVIFTFLPPLAFGLFDRTCSETAREKVPKLYKNSQQSDLFNVKVFWLWIGTAIMHSIILYYLPAYVFKFDTPFGDGSTVGQWFVGNVVYTCVVIAVCLKAAIELDTWNILSHFAIWGSIGSWFLFLLIYCRPFIAMTLAPNMIGQDMMLYSCPTFWLTILCIPVITLAPDFLYHAFQREFKKNTRQRIQEIELSGDDPANWTLDDNGFPIVYREPRERVGTNASIQSNHGFAFNTAEKPKGILMNDVMLKTDSTFTKPTGN